MSWLIPRPTYNQGMAATLLLLPLWLAGKLVVVLARFAVGWPLDGRPTTDAGLFRAASIRLDRTPRMGWWESRPYAARAGIRWGVLVGVLVLTVLYMEHRGLLIAAASAALAVMLIRGGFMARKAWQSRHFSSYYRDPLADVLRELLGHTSSTPARAFLEVNPELEGLTPPPTRADRSMSPFEQHVRYAYGQWIVRPLRWPADRLWQWRCDLATRRGSEEPKKGASTPARALKAVVKYFVRPPEDDTPRIAVTAAKGLFLEKDEKSRIANRVTEKLGLGDLQVVWNQKGKKSVGVFKKILRPPMTVDFTHLMANVEKLSASEFYVGQGPKNEPVIFDVDQDSPHIACSATSGGGKSILAMVIALQFLYRGDKVIILDRKGSHLWAKGIPGIVYCITQQQIHDALIEHAAEADKRNLDAFERGVTPDYRVLIVFEEMNSTVNWLQSYWAKIRENDDQKKSPAVEAFHELLFMGRSAYYHLFGVAQMLSAKATGGPEARENFGIRFLTRYTANAWKMLVPECAMPRKSNIRGRWQMAISGETTEVQVAYAGPEKARRTAEHAAVEGGHVAPVAPPDVTASPGPDQSSHAVTGATAGVPHQTTGDADALAGIDDPLSDKISIRTAIERGYLTGPSYQAITRRILRAQKADPDTAPFHVGIDRQAKNAKLFRAGDLIEFEEQWAEAERESE